MSSEQEMDENFPEEEVTEDSAVAEEGGDDSAAADADFTDEDWDDAGAEGAGDDAEAAADGDGAKKKKKKMNMMIIGAAAVVGLGVLYWQMSHKSVKLPPPTAMQAPVPVAAPTDQDIIYGKTGVDEVKIDKSKTPVSGLMNDPTLIKKVQKMSDSHVATTEELTPEPKATIHPVTPPMPAPITQAAPEKPDQPLTPMPQEAKGTPFTMAAATGNPVKPETPKEAVKETPKETAVAPPVKEIAKPIADPFAPEMPVKAPEVAKTPVTPPPVASIIPTTTPVAPVTPVALVAPAATAASSAELEKIVSKLDGIESEVKSLRDSSVSKDELASLQAQVASLESRMNGMSSAPAPVHHQAPKKAPKAEKPAAAKVESAPVRHQKAATPKWVLKSAQPGMAIVAKSDGQLVMIRPGDKVPGLGKVKTIAEEKGRWVVKGSAGTVTQ